MARPDNQKQRKFDTPFYNVSSEFMVKGFNDNGNYSVQVINKKSGEVLEQRDCKDKENAFKVAFDMEMETISRLKNAGQEDTVNPKALIAFGKHQAWKDRQGATYQ